MTFEIVSYTRISGYGLHRHVLATVKRPAAAETKFAEHVALSSGFYASHARGEAVTVTPMTEAFRGGVKSAMVALGATHSTVISVERKGHVPPPFKPAPHYIAPGRSRPRAGRDRCPRVLPVQVDS